MVQKVVRQPDYKDLDLDFIPHPTTKDVVKKVGVDAIKRSIRNLILTNFYEKPFRPFIGSNAQKLLFDNMNPLTETFLRNAIFETIVNYEPRVRLLEDETQGIVLTMDFDNNGYNARITFYIENRLEPVSINLFLERLR